MPLECKNHPAVPASVFCPACAQMFCPDCVEERNGNKICSSCKKLAQPPVMETPPVSSVRETASRLHSRGWRFWTALVVGSIVLLLGALCLITAISTFILAIRFAIGAPEPPWYSGRPHMGRDFQCAVASYKVGVGTWQTVLSSIFLIPGWLLIRNRLSKKLVRRILLITFAIASVLGIFGGLSAPGPF